MDRRGGTAVAPSMRPLPARWSSREPIHGGHRPSVEPITVRDEAQPGGPGRAGVAMTAMVAMPPSLGLPSPSSGQGRDRECAIHTVIQVRRTTSSRHDHRPNSQPKRTQRDVLRQPTLPSAQRRRATSTSFSADVARHRRTLLGVWAHPDDEAYLSAGLMAEFRRRGDRVVVVTATLGEHGTERPGDVAAGTSWRRCGTPSCAPPRRARRRRAPRARVRGRRTAS